MRPPRVLIVEDDKDTALSLLMLLRSDGYEASAVGSAKAMWNSVGDFEPDVLLIDINLPDRNGYDLVRDLHRTYGNGAPRPALIAVTGWNKGSDKILAELAGFDHHVGKPYDPDSLLALLRRVSLKSE
jgi:DNA-binding response OmpR family regulator